MSVKWKITVKLNKKLCVLMILLFSRTNLKIETLIIIIYFKHSVQHGIYDILDCKLALNSVRYLETQNHSDFVY